MRILNEKQAQQIIDRALNQIRQVIFGKENPLCILKQVDKGKLGYLVWPELPILLSHGQKEAR